MKITTSLTLDYDILELAKKRNINISKFLNDSLRTHLRMNNRIDDLKRERENLKEQLSILESQMENVIQDIDKAKKEAISICTSAYKRGKLTDDVLEYWSQKGNVELNELRRLVYESGNINWDKKSGNVE